MRRATALTAAVLAAGLACVPSAALADSASSNMQASAAVVANASVTATNLAFGNYIGQAVTAQSTIAVTATNGTNYTVTIDAGSSTGATATNRKLTNASQPSQTLAYGLYTNPARTTNWGSTSATGVNGVGSGATQVLPVYGSIPAAQTPLVGNYADTLTVTVTY